MQLYGTKDYKNNHGRKLWRGIYGTEPEEKLREYRMLTKKDYSSLEDAVVYGAEHGSHMAFVHFLMERIAGDSDTETTELRSTERYAYVVWRGE